MEFRNLATNWRGQQRRANLRPMTTAARFRAAYAEHRAAEGRGSGGAPELLALPYLRSGPRASEWAVRARSYNRFLRAVVAPRARARAPQPLQVLDLGAGNGWLCYRLALQGHPGVALDRRRDAAGGPRAPAADPDPLPPPFPPPAPSL